MPQSISFAQCNQIAYGEGGVKSMEVFADDRAIISKWEFSKEELEELNRNGGRFWLLFLSQTLPPTRIMTNNPFGENLPT